MKLKELSPGSPEAKRRDELLAIVNDETRSTDERLAAAIEAAPLCHEKRAVIVRAEASDAVEVSERDYDLDNDRDLLTIVPAAQGLVAKPLQ